MFQGLRRTLLAPIPIAVVGEAEGTRVLPPIIPTPVPGEGAVQVPSVAVEVVRRHTVVEEVALPHGDTADVEVGLPRYPLPPNRLVPVLVVHPLIGNIP